MFDIKIFKREKLHEHKNTYSLGSYNNTAFQL